MMPVGHLQRLTRIRYYHLIPRFFYDRLLVNMRLIQYYPTDLSEIRVPTVSMSIRQQSTLTDHRRGCRSGLQQIAPGE